MSEKIKTALVTGSSSGIGKAIAERLAGEGFYTLIHCNKSLKKAQDVLEGLLAAGGQGEILSFDVSDYTQVKESMSQFFKTHPDHQIEVLVNNAGFTKDHFFALLSEEDYRKVIETNLIGAMNVSHVLIRPMMRAKKGSVINIASLAGQTGNMGQTAYSASKAGLIAFTKSLAMEVGRKNIRVNAVAPGLIETEMLDGLPGLENLVQQTPLKRLGQGAEVADVVSFLCSNQSSFITGATLSVNGGLFPN